jgi:hypothetical protein
MKTTSSSPPIDDHEIGLTLLMMIPPTEEISVLKVPSKSVTKDSTSKKKVFPAIETFMASMTTTVIIPKKTPDRNLQAPWCFQQ